MMYFIIVVLLFVIAILLCYHTKRYNATLGLTLITSIAVTVYGVWYLIATLQPDPPPQPPQPAKTFCVGDTSYNEWPNGSVTVQYKNGEPVICEAPI